MTLGVGYEDRGDLASLLSEVSDRRHVSSSQQAFDVSPTYEVTKTMDPSGGANYSGGSSYTAGMPLTSSNAGLAGHDGSGFRNVNFGSMSYGEAMNWNPASMTQRIDALKAGAGRTFEGMGEASTMNPMWYYLGAAALAYFLLRPKEPQYGY